MLPFFVYELCAIDARARVADHRPEAVRRLRAFQMRTFLAAVLPLVFYGVVSGLLGLDEAVRVMVEEVALFNAMFAASFLAFLVLVLPTLLRNTWRRRGSRGAGCARCSSVSRKPHAFAAGSSSSGVPGT